MAGAGAGRSIAKAGPAVACLVAAEVILFLALPRGFAFGGVPLGLEIEGPLFVGALAAGAWGARSTKDRRVALGALGALALLSPAYDPRWPVERIPAYLLAGALFVLFVEFGLLNAKVARLAELPRAHVTQEGRRREIELEATASRIAGSWPLQVGAGMALLGVAIALQFGIAAALPPAPGQSVELHGPFGLALASVFALGGVGAYALRRARADAARQATQGADLASEPSTSSGASEAPRS